MNGSAILTHQRLATHFTAGDPLHKTFRVLGREDAVRLLDCTIGDEPSKPKGSVVLGTLLSLKRTSNKLLKMRCSSDRAQ